MTGMQVFIRGFAVVCVAWCMSLTGVLAQQLSALKGHNSDQPIDVSADHVDLQEQQNLAIFSGAVQVTQGDMILTTDQLRVYYVKAGADSKDLSIQRLDAEGAVKLSSPSEIVDSQWGVYDVEEDVITLGGTVRMQRGDTHLNGERLVLNLRSGQSTLDGGSGAEVERVRGRFSVPKKPDEKKPEEQR